MIKKYTFTVEGYTEKWYFEWLRDRINEIQETKCVVAVDAKVQQSPLKFAKTVNPLAVPVATHICDYESNDECHINKFHGILDQLNTANNLRGRSFRYKLGYSNFTFELWMILHKIDCNGALTDRTKYLKPLNRAYGSKFENLDQYKHEANFKWCLSQLNIENVRDAVRRSRLIMDVNRQNSRTEKEHRGFRYYVDNPALTIWESVEQMLRDCGIG